MDLLAAIKISFRSIIRSKIRTLLTMLGIIIGVAAVITMLSITSGARRHVMSIIETLGNNVMFIYAASQTRGGVRGGWGSIHTMRPEDAQAIQEYCQHVLYTSPFIRRSGLIIYKNRNTEAIVAGANENIFYIEDWEIEEGYFFGEAEVSSAAKVCVIGSEIKKNLFLPGENCLGENIRINRIPFQITGVLKSKGVSGMESRDEVIYIPYTTMMQRLYSNSYITSLIASATSREDSALARDEITSVLRQRHRLRSGEGDDFLIYTQEEIVEMIEEFVRNMTLLLGSVASVSLLVGGIGIMNIMLVTVTERIKEIGIRMAVGARRKDIMIQFLVESVTLSLSGGIIGIGLGYGTSYLLKKLTTWKIFVSPFSIVLAVTFASAVGIFFGIYPAYKASRLDPIEALRHE